MEMPRNERSPENPQILVVGQDGMALSGGNGDGLTWLQSIPMAQRLSELEVPVTELFWPAPHQPEPPHEYQFHLDRPEAQEALTATIDWLAQTTNQP